MSETYTNNDASPQGNRKAIYIAIIILLLGTNAFFIYDHFSGKKVNEDLEKQRTELNSKLAGVSDTLKAKIQEYEQQKGINHTLDSTIDANIAELQAKQKQVERAINDKNATVGQLNKAKKEIDELRNEKGQFTTRINSLTTALKYMSQVNDTLNINLKSKTAEGEQLKSEKQVLAKKVEVGSLLKPTGIAVTGVKFKSNGKEVETASAKKSEKIRVCFDVPENQVADPGQKEIMVRIQDPKGATIAVESEGSGIFVASTGEQKQYTMKAPFDFDNKQKHVCVYWKQTNPLIAGDYKVEFYQNGTFLSESAFTLKK